MIVPLNVELHLSDDLTPEQRAEAVAYAADMDTLGVDHAPDADAPFPEVLAHLLMFAPAWLFSRPWVAGWTATDAEPAPAA